ncbi:hypothetical protein GCM10025771_27670 [Niveibacterium umoris]|uniref:Uncharacterized protein n=1 Tax=Niveibacterium umoris TaxID=1193620 RepID=A0A840BGA4_9RHOO|nr:hypothetical protein [Niveibacterium umoris]MBB4012040.1 hypothetical protein [Niveibacterium umoris]
MNAPSYDQLPAPLDERGFSFIPEPPSDDEMNGGDGAADNDDSEGRDSLWQEIIKALRAFEQSGRLPASAQALSAMGKLYALVCDDEETADRRIKAGVLFVLFGAQLVDRGVPPALYGLPKFYPIKRAMFDRMLLFMLDLLWLRRCALQQRQRFRLPATQGRRPFFAANCNKLLSELAAEWYRFAKQTPHQRKGEWRNTAALGRELVFLHLDARAGLSFPALEPKVAAALTVVQARGDATNRARSCIDRLRFWKCCVVADWSPQLAAHFYSGMVAPMTRQQAHNAIEKLRRDLPKSLIV